MKNPNFHRVSAISHDYRFQKIDGPSAHQVAIKYVQGLFDIAETTRELSGAQSDWETEDEIADAVFEETASFDQVQKLKIAIATEHAKATHAAAAHFTDLERKSRGESKDDHLGTNSGDSPSTESVEPGYLSLIVDEAHCVVTRSGERYERFDADFEVGIAEWHTFCVAWKAGSVGAKKAAWENGYPRTLNSQNKRAVKKRVNQKLSVLDVKLKAFVPPMLIEVGVT